MKVRLGLWLLLLSGCAHRGGGPAVSDPAAVVARARAAAMPFALQARYAVDIHQGNREISTRGGLVLDRGARFRVEVFGPLGTPALVLASDGTALHVWNQSNSTFYRGDQAKAALETLTGGGVGLADLGRILTGRVPLPGAPVLSASADGDAVALSLDAGGGAVLDARIDPKSGLLSRLSVQRAGEPAQVAVDYGRSVRVGGERLPATLTLAVAALDLEVELRFESWDQLGQIPDVFSLAPPPGSVEKDLLESLKEAAERQGVHPPP